MKVGMKITALAVAMAFTVGCATERRSGYGGSGLENMSSGAKATFFIEPSIRPGEVTVRRVAIVPNRLPSNLKDPEKWRKYNWGQIEKAFRSRGFDVVDYETSVNAFERSGLPVEDTRSSRDKYAELAAALGVDAVIIPYYAALHYSEQVLILATQHFISTLTFQIYYAAKNDFGGRVDATGEVTYDTGTIAVSSLATGLIFIGLGALGVGAEQTCIGGQCFNGASPLTTVGSATMGIGTLIDAIYSGVLTSLGADHYWELAFNEAVQKGLDPWFASYSAGVPGAGSNLQPSAPYSPQAPSYMPAPAAGGGCQSNADCKGGRVCQQGACTSR